MRMESHTGNRDMLMLEQKDRGSDDNIWKCIAWTKPLCFYSNLPEVCS